MMNGGNFLQSFIVKGKTGRMVNLIRLYVVLEWFVHPSVYY